jgi:transcriptional regulator with XRE-family HTH domain
MMGRSTTGGESMRVKDPSLLRERRVRRRLTQRELAFLVRRSQATVWQLESGRLRTVSPQLARAIADRLDTPCSDLFEPRPAHDGPDDPTTPDTPAGGPA